MARGRRLHVAVEKPVTMSEADTAECYTACEAVRARPHRVDRHLLTRVDRHLLQSHCIRVE